MALGREDLDGRFWWHAIDLGKGVVAAGRKGRAVMEMEADPYFRDVDLAGRSVPDVGAWTGGFSVEAKRRGADRVLATDTYCWRNPEYKGRETFDMVVGETGPDMAVREIDATEIGAETVGRFDVVLFLGVFHHLFDPSP